MSFKTVLKLLTILTILSRTIAGLLLFFLNNSLPLIFHLFSGALIIYAIGILLYDKFKTLNSFPFVILFLSETVIFIINLFVINYISSDKWYNIHLPMFEQIIIGNFISVIINLIIIIYYFHVVRRACLNNIMRSEK